MSRVAAAAGLSVQSCPSEGPTCGGGSELCVGLRGPTTDLGAVSASHWIQPCWFAVSSLSTSYCSPSLAFKSQLSVITFFLGWLLPEDRARGPSSNSVYTSESAFYKRGAFHKTPGLGLYPWRVSVKSSWGGGAASWVTPVPPALRTTSVATEWPLVPP